MACDFERGKGSPRIAFASVGKQGDGFWQYIGGQRVVGLYGAVEQGADIACLEGL